MLTVYTLDQAEQWDSIVRSFREYDVYWLSGYVKAFKIHGDGEPLLFYYEDSVTRGINVVMKRDVACDEKFKGEIPEDRYYDFATPYGYGGWIVEGDNRRELFDSYSEWCKNNSIVSEFVRFHPVLNNEVFSEKEYDIIPMGSTVALDLSTPEIIWNNITSKNRNMIRKAKKNGVKIYNGRYPEIYQVFREIYNQTMEKDQAAKYYFFETDFYQSLCEDLAQNSQVFYAVLDGKVIAASIMVGANSRMNYHLSGSLREYSNFASTNLLLYEASLWGSANGYKTLYLGGGVGSNEDSLYKFKKSFYRLDGTLRFYIGKKIHNLEKYNQLLRINKSSISGYFPEYRM